jgi:hypothetical protein
MLFFRKVKSSKGRQSIRKLRASYHSNSEANTATAAAVNAAETETEDEETGNDYATLADHPDLYPLQAHNIVEVLTGAGYVDYLQEVLADGDRKPDCVRRAVRIIAEFLHHAHVQYTGVPIRTDEEVLPWLRKVIKKQYRLLQAYTKHLAEDRQCKPSTIKNYILFIDKCTRWYVLFCPHAKGMKLSALTRMKDVSGVLLRALARKEKVARAAVSLAALVRDRRMPAGGLPELQSRVDAQIQWAENLSMKRVNKDEYEAFMELMYAALYVYSVQGRQSGVMDMKYKQAAELLARGYSNSSKFKTAAKWKYQPVTLSATTYLLLQAYVTRVRPQVWHEQPSGDDPLWLTYDGNAERKLGLRVTRFFRKAAGLHITTTAIRSLVETAMHAGFRQGRITEQEMHSVQAINGHSSQVTADYYIQEDRAQNVAQARSAFERCVVQPEQASTHLEHDVQREVPAPIPLAALMLAPASVVTMPPPARSPQMALSPPPGATVRPVHFNPWAQTEPLAAADWGSAHGSYGTDCKKAPWTDEEVRYVGNWCDQHPPAPNGHSQNLVAMCLRHIRSDPVALSIFHQHHVLDNGRLRHGYRKYLKLKEEGQWVSGL